MKPPRYVSYPRGSGTETYGTVEKLRALGEGYFEMGAYVAIFFLDLLGFAALGLYIQAIGLVGAVLIVLLVMVLFSFLSYSTIRKIAFGCDWSSRTAIMTSILLGVTSCLLVGIIVSSVIETLIRREMKKYGLTVGLLFYKQNFETFLQERIDRDRQRATLTPFIDGPEVG